ncbi:hypothetical protein CSUI_009759 [Cystoisospora suis]|uniref:Transmembrane protein n=1 Tax=Cystoisospora suis TaxID=483139 RepID=A0A2C6KIW1_9APIC|nr:hypothetical protein CSUI_009759 [Cystoisospora suis]
MKTVLFLFSQNKPLLSLQTYFLSLSLSLLCAYPFSLIKSLRLPLKRAFSYVSPKLLSRIRKKERKKVDRFLLSFHGCCVRRSKVEKKKKKKKKREKRARLLLFFS